MMTHLGHIYLQWKNNQQTVRQSLINAIAFVLYVFISFSRSLPYFTDTSLIHQFFDVI